MIYKRRKKPYKRPRFNVGWKLALVKRLQVVAGARPAPEAELKALELAGTAPAPELKGVMGRKLAVAVE